MRRFSVAVATLALLSACDRSGETEVSEQAAPTETVVEHSARANAFFDQVFDEAVARSPMYQSYLGIKTDYDRWDDISDERDAEELEFTKQALQALRETFDYDRLDAQTQVSYDLFVADSERDIEGYQWRRHNYPINQMGGVHSQVPSFLINIHRISDVADAEAYLSRLNGVPKLVEQSLDQVAARAELGILPPKFTFPYVIEAARNVVSGAPFDPEATEDSTLLADFRAKVSALEIDAETRDALIERADAALLESVKPAYEQLIEAVQQFESQATADDGAWKLPDGEAYYNFALQRTTTTTLSADEIHDIGLAEVARIQDEMREIRDAVGFDGDLQAFFAFLREDAQFYYPDTEAGRDRYLTEATAYIDDMRERLDDLFLRKPEAEIIVKRVEPFRERSAGKAFYQQPTPDGSRPGTYYANLFRMADMPIYQMQALAYHEGIPGHHMQIAIAQELDGLPKFRRFGRYTAYTEGWGLYSEVLPKDIDAYTDPYQDFGRLAMEIWRAARLVVDTGIHAKQWNREQAIQYLMDNTPNPEGDAIKAIERYILWPSQATAYKIGMIKILELRSRAEQALGDRFDIREFHDVVLRNGPVPLDVLEQFVDQYIAAAGESQGA